MPLQATIHGYYKHDNLIQYNYEHLQTTDVTNYYNYYEHTYDHTVLTHTANITTREC